jgi:hypothetical protein
MCDSHTFRFVLGLTRSMIASKAGTLCDLVPPWRTEPLWLKAPSIEELRVSTLVVFMFERLLVSGYLSDTSRYYNLQ